MSRGIVVALVSLIALATIGLSIEEPGARRADLHQCEGCEAIHEHALEGLPWSAVIPPEGEPGERLVLTGRVYKTDRRTPAPGVVVYAYHTNSSGIYPKRGDEKGWGRRHGYLRAWVRTNESGDYRFETVRPGTYPTRSDPAHVHMIIKEPDRREYWIDEVVFTDDPLVTGRYRAGVRDQGGSGIVTPEADASGAWTARRDIFLEP